MSELSGAHAAPRTGRLAAQLALAVLALALAAPAACGQVLLFDDFSGPSLNPAFQAALPNNTLFTDGFGPTSYLGAPGYQFQSVGGSTVIRLTNTLNDRQRRGWSTTSFFTAQAFRLEARFNTLVQSPASSIDAFVELWLIDAADPSRYDVFSPYGGNNSATKSVFSRSSFSPGGSQSLNYQDATWYRMTIQGSASQGITTQFLDDQGTPLYSFSYNHTPLTFPSGFRIGLSQAVGTPGRPAPVDVAVDFVSLVAVPEPSGIALAGPLALAALACTTGVARRRRTDRALDS